MRFSFVTLLCVLGGTVVAQDATQLAIQQQQITQQQITQQQINLINQQQMNQASTAGLESYQLGLRAPQLRQKPGTQPGTVVVTMNNKARGASVFYTTDGWTPTAASERYVGPVTVRENVTLRAIAIGAGGLRSYVSVLPPDTGDTPTAVESGVLRVGSLDPGTHLPLVFDKPVSSRGMKVGDRLPVSLADDLFVNGHLAAAKGAPVEAVVTEVDNSRIQGLPGALSFAVQSIRLQNGVTISLLGVETMEGTDRTKKAMVASIIPLGGLAVHGGDAQITAGARLEAEVARPTDQNNPGTK